MNQIQKIRLNYIKLYQELGNAGLVCLRCGISRPTLRKWLRRYDLQGVDGLLDRSHKPNHSPAKKVFKNEEDLIFSLRKDRNLGVRRIKNELKRLHNISLSVATIQKVLSASKIPYLQKKRYYKKVVKRYNCKTPGERIQIDVCKIANGLYQYTAIDDCTRYKVIELYSRRTAENSLDFIEQITDRFPFPFQRIQTDRGREFFAYKFQEKLMEYGIKFRPIKPRSPHLNGKVERSQRTDLDEFYSTVNIKDPDLKDKLAQWEFYYNWHRNHSSLGNKTPWDKYIENINKTPFWEDISEAYDLSKERIKEQNYRADLAEKLLKQSL